MTLHRWTPRELKIAIERGRLLDLVPKGAIKVQPLGPALFELSWPAGPRGHAIVGICPELCHLVVEYPQAWRRRGREIARGLFETFTPLPLRFSDNPDLFA